MKPTGTNSGRPQSAVIIPVPEAEQLLAAWRRDHQGAAPADLPAHVTLVVPWLAPEAISPAAMDELASVVGAVGAWDFALERVGYFGHRVLYLEPDPADAFCELTRRVASHFATPPYDGDFADVVPHVTVGFACKGEELDHDIDELLSGLPVKCRADEVWVMVGDGVSWELRGRSRLGEGL